MACNYITWKRFYNNIEHSVNMACNYTTWHKNPKVLISIPLCPLSKHPETVKLFRTIFSYSIVTHDINVMIT